MICYDNFKCNEPDKIRYLINYGILVCSEADRLLELLHNLRKNKVPFNQLIVVIDSQNTNPEVQKIVIENKLIYYFRPFTATCDQRNFLKDKCWLPYIFFIDVDETLGEGLLQEAYKTLARGVVREILGLPRANRIIQDVEPLFKSPCGWEENKDGLWGWPDWQPYRIIRNLPHLRYVGKGHDGMSLSSLKIPSLPLSVDYALIHTKRASEHMIRSKLWSKLGGNEQSVSKVEVEFFL
jgi:hypothetical protein